MHLRPFTPADAEAMHTLHSAAVSQTCATSYTPTEIEAWLKGRTAGGYVRAAESGENFLIAEENGQIQGFSSWQGSELVSLFVHPAAKGRGLGKALVAAAEAASQQAGNPGLAYVEASLNARTFYMKLGFEVESWAFKLKHEVKVPHLVMRRNLA